MPEPFASTPLQSACLSRVSAALDASSTVIAGFALLAGARAFGVVASLGWREPVLGGAGLVLLAAIGWLRWRCGDAAERWVPRPARRGRARSGADLLATIGRCDANRNATAARAARAANAARRPGAGATHATHATPSNPINDTRRNKETTC